MPLRVVMQIARAVYRPPCFPGVIVHAEVVADQVIDVGPHDLPHGALFRLGVGYQVVIERIEKIMAVQFVRAGVAFPVIAAVGRLGPARLVDSPITIPLLPEFPLALQRVAACVRIPPGGGRQHGPRDESRRRFMLGVLGCLAQETQRLKRAFGPALGQGSLRRAVGKAFPRPVHARPQAVVVAVSQVKVLLPPRNRRVGTNDITELGASMVLVDLVLVMLRLLCERHAVEMNERYPARRGHPGIACGVHGDVAHCVARQPTLPLPVRPG